MAEHKDHKEESGGGLSGPIGLLLVLGVIVLFWYINGGEQKVAERGSQALLVQSPIAQSGTHSWLPFLTPEQQGKSTDSPTAAPTQSALRGKLSISDYSGARASDPSREYMLIYAASTNTGPVALGGLVLTSSRTGRSATIPGGTETALMGQAAASSPILLMPGQSAIVSTGRSPVGLSFRENKCSAYLAQFQTFTPSLARRCPDPLRDVPQGLATDSQCMQAVSGIDACATVLSAPSAPAGCSQFMTERFTYNGCVAAHRNDTDFLSAEWRVYLGMGQELWNNTGDTIRLLDAQGKIITDISY